jgi:hypothetical protein
MHFMLKVCFHPAIPILKRKEQADEILMLTVSPLMTSQTTDQ